MIGGSIDYHDVFHIQGRSQEVLMGYYSTLYIYLFTGSQFLLLTSYAAMTIFSSRIDSMSFL